MTAVIEQPTRTAYEAYIAAVVAKAPPLTAQQSSRLAVLFASDDPIAEMPRQRRAA